MLMIISPAKTLDFETAPTTTKTSDSNFLQYSQELINILKNYSPADISTMMKVSEKIGILNFERFNDWELPFNLDNAKQAILAFKGDVYNGINASTMSENDLMWANNNLIILSGLYGALSPLDLMQPYRLEMGTKLNNDKGNNLYDFWGNKITNHINNMLSKDEYPTLINLASNEYYKVLQPKSIAANIITPIFKDEKNGKYKIISFYAKKARGLMTRWIIDNRIDSHKELSNFNVDGYFYDPQESDSKNFVFKREEK